MEEKQPVRRERAREGETEQGRPVQKDRCTGTVLGRKGGERVQSKNEGIQLNLDI